MNETAEYKSLYIMNESRDVHLTLYLYHQRDLLCWISFESKIIKPNQKCFHRSENGFKFKLLARFEDNRSKGILLGPEKWVEDKLLKITGSVVLTVGKLEDFPTEKRVCLRQFHRTKETTTGTNGKRNLYEILGLNMDQVRKMPKEEQIKDIKKWFKKEINLWHPDNNYGDDEIAKEILAAYKILRDDEKRARYNNETDYDEGWLSLKRYKAIFRPECFTGEQNKAYRKRRNMFLVSVGMTIAGIAVTVSTAGLAAPVAVALGAVFGSGLIGAGLQSLQHSVNRESVTNECDTKKWGMKAGIGFVGGVATGGAAVGITAGVAGLGSAAMESAALTAGQYIGIGAGSGAVGGVASSLASDAGRKFADEQNVTWKQVLGHAACGAAVGAAAGAAGGAVTKSLVSSQTSAATANLKGEIGEQIVILTGARRLDVLARNVSRALTENGTEAVMGSVAQFAEERLDDSVENRSPGEHLINGAKNVAVSSTVGVAKETGIALVSHVRNKIKVGKRAKKLANGPLDYEDITRGGAREELSKESKEHRVNWKRDAKYSFRYQPPDNEELSLAEPDTRRLSTIFKDATHNESEALDKPEDCKFKYISDGYWISKMVVSYVLDGKTSTREGSGSGTFVTVPSAAREVEVRFQVRRPFWGDILKYDGLKRCWCKPMQPHVFRYDCPPTLRTFTISGSLWYETVMVSGDETEECRFKYISEGHWTSRMIVSYFFNDNQAKQEVSGSGECVTIPSTARQVKVKFQVMRPFWGDIKKYDPFKKCWQPHVFRYDRPPTLRLFAISGRLWYETAMEVGDETEECRFKYISEGHWTSRMIVSYFFNDNQAKQEVSVSGECVTIPSTATQVEVKFQVMRPFWGDIKKYDPFKKCWQPHVFRYDRPPTLRTFAISGRLWYEIAMVVGDETEECRFKYISEGHWTSRMIVSYFFNDNQAKREVSGSDKCVTIPSTARQVEVKFQVMRPFWGDIQKYDPLKERWQPHVFRYDRPPTLCTFAISGSLWYETAMVVGNETEECRFKYISEGHWTSRMIVSYFFNGNQAKQEVSGSGECVTIPSTARQVEVKFQVMRPFWGDIKKYDRFKGCWCQSNESHVIKYDTPPARRTFTISGSLWFEAIVHKYFTCFTANNIMAKGPDLSLEMYALYALWLVVECSTNTTFRI